MLELKDYEILCGDALERLKDIPDNTVQTCITSPPYYGLRDYGTGKWVGGDPNCPHKRLSKFSEKTITGHAQEELIGNVGDAIYKTVCPLCGAIREDKQIGLEETPEQYIDKLVKVFREVKRVLKDDGTLWVNIGDSYNGAKRGNTNEINKRTNTDSFVKPLWLGAKEKDLIGIPWMLAFALRSDGWYLRQDIIWHKPNPMPESVEDRCTKSHEYIFLLSKKSNYYFDYEAIEEPITYNDGRLPGVVRDRLFEYDSKRNNNPEAFMLKSDDRKPHSSDYKYLDSKYDSRLQESSVRQGMHKDRGKGLTDITIETDAIGKSSHKNLQYDGQQPNTMHLRRAEGLADDVYATRRKRDVWSVNVASYKGAHFATFPEKLIEPCILAGSKEGDIVLDPFNGSGTTGAVSLKHKRKYIGVELNPEYIKLTEDRFDSITYVEKHVDKVTGEVTKIQMVDLF